MWELPKARIGLQTSNSGWRIREKNRFLSILMEGLAGNAYVSFEGGSSILGLSAITGAQGDESGALLRNTIVPRQNLIIVPLEPETLTAIWKGVGGTISRDVLHIQIEKNGQLAFGAYDGFHPECITFGHEFPAVLIDSLIEERLLERSGSDLDRRDKPASA